MTDQEPVERAAFDSRFRYYDGYTSPARQDDLFEVFQTGMQYALASIDTDELADVISGWPIGSGYYSLQISIDEAQDIAQAVKNWLNGKEASCPSQ